MSSRRRARSGPHAHRAHGPARPRGSRRRHERPARGRGHGVHVVGPRGTYANTTDVSDSHYFADSSCPTCRLTLLSVGRSFAYVSEPHSHSQDELIHVVSGAIIARPPAGRAGRHPRHRRGRALRLPRRRRRLRVRELPARRVATDVGPRRPAPARRRCGQRHDPRDGPDLTPNVLASLRSPLLGVRSDAKTMSEQE